MSIYLFFIYIYLLKLTDAVQYFPYTVQRTVCKLHSRQRKWIAWISGCWMLLLCWMCSIADAVDGRWGPARLNALYLFCRDS